MDGAGALVSRLETIALERPSVAFVVATAALVRGRLCLARHEPEAAACFREALAVFARAQVPVQVAHVRLDLARALATDKPAVAAAEATAHWRATAAWVPTATLTPPPSSCAASASRPVPVRRAGS